MTTISWANLPPDVIFSISEVLDSHTELLRFRAVCNSWRRFIIPPPQESRELPKLMNFPSEDPDDRVMITYKLYQTTVFHLEEAESSPNDGWLLMVTQPNFEGKFCLLNPFTMCPVENPPDDFPKLLNSLKFRVTEVCNRFSLQWIGTTRRDGADENPEQAENYDDDDDDLQHKAVLSAEFDSTNSFFVIDEARLCSVTIGEDFWTLVNTEIKYRDLVFYNGSLFGVDRHGVVVSVEDFSHDSVTIPALELFLGDWYLFKSCGELFLVGRDYRQCGDQVIYDGDEDSFVKRPGFNGDVLVDFKVYVLELKENPTIQVWVELEDLGDYVFFVSHNCSYAIEASDFNECEGNHIIFVDEVEDPIDDVNAENNPGDGGDDAAARGILEGIKVGVYDVEEGLSAPLEACPNFQKIFWPPPPWLNSGLSPMSH